MIHLQGHSLPSRQVRAEQRDLLPARIDSYAPGQVRISAETPEGGWLVLSDLFYPGWEALVDGAPAPIYQANYLFRGVAVPAGEHQVRWSYRPAAFSFGCAISVVTLMGLFASLLVTKFKTSEAPPSPLGGEGRGERSC